MDPVRDLKIRIAYSDGAAGSLQCLLCTGTGLDSGAVPCRKCGGFGATDHRNTPMAGGTRDCTLCNGTGIDAGICPLQTPTPLPGSQRDQARLEARLEEEARAEEARLRQWTQEYDPTSLQPPTTTPAARRNVAVRNKAYEDARATLRQPSLRGADPRRRSGRSAGARTSVPHPARRSLSRDAQYDMFRAGLSKA